MLAPTVLVPSQNSFRDTHSLLCFVTGKMVAFELCDQQSSVQAVRAGVRTYTFVKKRVLAHVLAFLHAHMCGVRA